VKGNDRQNCDCPESLDIRSEMGRRARYRLHVCYCLHRIQKQGIQPCAIVRSLAIFGYSWGGDRAESSC
jgi:hypothetical protein